MKKSFECPENYKNSNPYLFTYQIKNFIIWQCFKWKYSRYYNKRLQQSDEPGKTNLENKKNQNQNQKNKKLNMKRQ